MQERHLEAFDLDSALIGDRLRVSIALPSGPYGNGRLPVVYALDPAFTLETVKAAASWLPLASRIAGGDIPQTIVVGVGYAAEDLGEIMARRARDFTPSDGKSSPIQLPPFPLGFGGADRFLKVLVDEVFPRVAADFPVDTEETTLFGWSFGGLFALYTLFHRPESFSRYLVVSPSIWWDDRILFQYEQKWADAHSNLTAKLFLAVGAEEQTPGGGWKNEGFPDEAIAAVQQVTNSKELANRLGQRRYQGLELECAVFEGEYHLTVPATAATRGLLWLLSQH